MQRNVLLTLRQIEGELAQHAAAEKRSRWMKIGAAGVIVRPLDAVVPCLRALSCRCCSNFLLLLSFYSTSYSVPLCVMLSRDVPCFKGGLLIGLTGGLAAPLVAAGVGTAFGTSAAITLSTTAGVYAIGTLFAAGGAGLTGYHMKRRVGKLEEFFFVRLSQHDDLAVTIAVGGWACEQDTVRDFIKPWTALDPVADTYCLVWEQEVLTVLTRTLSKMLKDEAVGMAINQVLKHTLLAGIMAAIAWPAAILKVIISHDLVAS